MSMRLAATVKLGGGSFYPYGPRYLGYTPDLEPGGGAIGLMGHWRGGGRRGHTAFFGGMDFSFTWADIRNFFSRAGEYQQGRMLDGPEWRPVAGPEGRTGPAAGREQTLVQGDTVVLNPNARQRPVSIAPDRVTADLPTAPRDFVAVDLIRHPELRLSASEITGVVDPSISSAPAANEPNWQRTVYEVYMGIPGMHIGNS